jgi:uncharacterized protein YpmS
VKNIKIMMKQLNFIVLIIFALMLSSLACNLSFGKPASGLGEVPVVSATVEENIAGSNQNSGASGLVQFEITEAQIAELIDKELQQHIGDQISNLQIYLRAGQIQIIGNLESRGISAPVNVIIDVTVDPVGRPRMDIISSSVGPFAVPGDIVDEVERLVNKAFQEKILSLAPNLHIDDIVIQNGIMTVYGHPE